MSTTSTYRCRRCRFGGREITLLGVEPLQGFHLFLKRLATTAKERCKQKNLFMTLPYSQCEGKDEDTDVVEEDDGHEGVHVALHVAGGGELLGDIVFPVNVRMHKTLHDPIEQATEDDAYREAHTDVAQIMNTEVETGEGGGERPEDEGGCHFGTAEEPREKDGNAHGVAGVA